MLSNDNIGKISKNYSDAIVLPKIIHIWENLYIAAFYVMKLLPARHILHEAYKEGRLKENSIIAETSSGSFAFGIATICREMNLPFHIVSDPQMDSYLQRQLESLGGKIHIVAKPLVKGGFQAARLKILSEILDNNPNSFWPCQYDNLDNPNSYTILSQLLLDLFGSDLILVGTVGSGGSTCGTIRLIREKNPEAVLVGVDTFNSVLFGQSDGHRLLRGLGNSILPKNLDHTVFDQVHWVTAAEAFAETRLLHSKKGIFCGPTTGAAFQVARWTAKKNPKKSVVFISPDEGHRYINTVYNDSWLQENNLYLSNSNIECPKLVNIPLEAKECWSYMQWNRIKLADIAPK